jgi:hypothetical protein
MTESDHPPLPDQSKPSFTELLDWLEGRVTRESAAAMDQESEFGDDEQATITWIEGFRRFAAENPVPQPPPIVKQRLRQAFQRHHGNEPIAVHQTAHPTFDSRDDVVMAGVRGHAEVDEGYQRTFATDSHGVLIDIVPVDGSTVRIEGQVLGVESEPGVWEVQAVSPIGTLADITGDENGSFSLARAPLATEMVRLTNGQLTIEIPDPLGR